MLVPYDFFQFTALDDVLEEMRATQCRIYGRELMAALNITSRSQFERAVRTAMRALAALHIPVRHHIRQVYIYDGSTLRRDYVLSHLASYLVTINSDPANPRVARAQLFFVTARSHF